MPEPLIHFIVPFSVLVMCAIGVKKSALLASFAILPDFDVLFHVHRSFSHSVFFILLLCAPVIIIAAAKHSKMTRDAIIVTLVLLSAIRSWIYSPISRLSSGPCIIIPFI